MANAYTTLSDGTVGICGTGLRAGEKVQVVRRDARTRTEVVGEILAERAGVQVARIASTRSLAPPPARPAHRGRPRRERECPTGGECLTLRGRACGAPGCEREPANPRGYSPDEES